MRRQCATTLIRQVRGGPHRRSRAGVDANPFDDPLSVSIGIASEDGSAIWDAAVRNRVRTRFGAKTRQRRATRATRTPKTAIGRRGRRRGNDEENAGGVTKSSRRRGRPWPPPPPPQTRRGRRGRRRHRRGRRGRRRSRRVSGRLGVRRSRGHEATRRKLKSAAKTTLVWTHKNESLYKRARTRQKNEDEPFTTSNHSELAIVPTPRSNQERLPPPHTPPPPPPPPPVPQHGSHGGLTRNRGGCPRANRGVRIASHRKLQGVDAADGPAGEAQKDPARLRGLSDIAHALRLGYGCVRCR